MSDDGLEAGCSGDSLADALTAIRRGDDDTSDVLEIGSKVDDPSIGLLVTVEDVDSGQGVYGRDVELGLD